MIVRPPYDRRMPMDRVGMLLTEEHVYTYTYIYICIYIYIYTYMYRERERKKKRYVCMYVRN